MKHRFVTLLVTGTPGTGKTVLAKKLSLLLNYAYFDVNSFVKKAHIYTSYDRKRSTYVVDEAELSRSLIKVREQIGRRPIQHRQQPMRIDPRSIVHSAKGGIAKALKTSRKGILFDSHLSHFLPRKYADLCLVTTCSLKALEQRLLKKGYGKAKVRENLDAEIFDSCLTEAVEQGHKILKFDTTKATAADAKALAARISRIVRT